MDSMGMIPFLDQPVMLHSSRDPGECTMTPEQCAYKTQYWVNWYQADHRYALPTVAFFLTAIVLFAIGHFLSALAPERVQRSAIWSRSVSFFRYLSYKGWRVAGWNTQSLGIFLLGGAGLVFFLGKFKTSIRTLFSVYYDSDSESDFDSNDPWASPLLLA